VLKAVIFDMDGVLIDSHPVHKVAWKKFFSRLGRPVSDTELDFVLDGRKKEEILRHFLGDLSAQAIERLGHQKEMLFRKEAHRIRMIRGAFGLLQELHARRIRMAVASSGSAARVRYILDRLGLGSWFGSIVTGDDVSNGKPDPAIFQRAADQLDVDHRHVLVIEDAVAGVRAAKTAGMRCLGIGEGKRVHALLSAGADAVLPDLTTASLRDLERLVAGQRPN